METLIKKPSELKLANTYRFYFKKKPKEEAFDFIEGIVDLVNKDKVRLVGLFQNNRILKLLTFSSFKKVVRPEYNIVLPKEIIQKSLVKNKEVFDNEFVKNGKKVAIKDASKLMSKGRKIRYYFPFPVSQDNLSVDCLISEVSEFGYHLQSLDGGDLKVTNLFIRKESDAKIQFLNKNVKLPVEIKQEYQHLNNNDAKLFENIKKNIFTMHKSKKALPNKKISTVVNTKKTLPKKNVKNVSIEKDVEKIKKAIEQKNKIKKSK